MTLKEIQKMPTIVDGIHESVFKCHQILVQVNIMMDRGDSVDTIAEVINILEENPLRNKDGE